MAAPATPRRARREWREGLLTPGRLLGPGLAGLSSPVALQVIASLRPRLAAAALQCQRRLRGHAVRCKCSSHPMRGTRCASCASCPPAPPEPLPALTRPRLTARSSLPLSLACCIPLPPRCRPRTSCDARRAALRSSAPSPSSGSSPIRRHRIARHPRAHSRRPPPNRTPRTACPCPYCRKAWPRANCGPNRRCASERARARGELRLASLDGGARVRQVDLALLSSGERRLHDAVDQALLLMGKERSKEARRVGGLSHVAYRVSK